MGHMLETSAPCPLQRSLRRFGTQMPRKSRKCLPGPPAPKPPKSLQKVWGAVRKASVDTFRRLSRALLPRLSLRLLGDSSGFRGQRPLKTFSRLFRHFGPEAPERPLQGAGRIPNMWHDSWRIGPKNLSTLKAVRAISMSRAQNILPDAWSPKSLASG